MLRLYFLWFVVIFLGNVYVAVFAIHAHMDSQQQTVCCVCETMLFVRCQIASYELRDVDTHAHTRFNRWKIESSHQVCHIKNGCHSTNSRPNKSVIDLGSHKSYAVCNVCSGRNTALWLLFEKQKAIILAHDQYESFT